MPGKQDFNIRCIKLLLNKARHLSEFYPLLSAYYPMVRHQTFDDFSVPFALMRKNEWIKIRRRVYPKKGISTIRVSLSTVMGAFQIFAFAPITKRGNVRPSSCRSPLGDGGSHMSKSENLKCTHCNAQKKSLLKLLPVNFFKTVCC